MYFVFYAKDREDAGDLRIETRPAHVDWLKSLGDRLLHGGPLLDQGKMCGSLLIVEGGSLDEVAEILAQDPYAKAGLFGQTSINEWKWVFGAPDSQ